MITLQQNVAHTEVEDLSSRYMNGSDMYDNNNPSRQKKHTQNKNKRDTHARTDPPRPGHNFVYFNKQQSNLIPKSNKPKILFVFSVQVAYVMQDVALLK